MIKSLLGQPKIILHAVIPNLLRPHFPASLPVLKKYIDELFSDNVQFKQTLLLDYYMALIDFQPEEAVKCT